MSRGYLVVFLCIFPFITAIARDLPIFMPMNTINCKSRLIDLRSPIVMGILNVTPDSFYDGGRWADLDHATEQIHRLANEGADILDVGGMSSRPGADILSPEDEVSRVLPVIARIRDLYPDLPISIDTVHGSVARAAITAGASLINDISAGAIDPSIIDVAVQEQVPYILMHMQGRPSDMQDDPLYDDVVMEVLTFLKDKVIALRARGLHDIVIDPGFGFGKSIDQNYRLLRRLSSFRILDCPVMVGLSRKSMLYKPLEITAGEALNATTAAHMVALSNGAQILRVHDVAAAKQAIMIHHLASGKSADRTKL